MPGRQFGDGGGQIDVDLIRQGLLQFDLLILKAIFDGAESLLADADFRAVAINSQRFDSHFRNERS